MLLNEMITSNKINNRKQDQVCCMWWSLQQVIHFGSLVQIEMSSFFLGLNGEQFWDEAAEAFMSAGHVKFKENIKFSSLYI